MNKILLDHQRFLARHDFAIPRDANLEHCTDAELGLITKYGTWMEAIEQGLLTPITGAQRHFLLVCDGKEAPAIEFEIAWEKFRRGMQGNTGNSIWKKGRELDSRSPRTWMACPVCGGTKGTGYPCPRCGGTGWLNELSSRNKSEHALARGGVRGASRGHLV